MDISCSRGPWWLWKVACSHTGVPQQLLTPCEQTQSLQSTGEGRYLRYQTMAAWGHLQSQPWGKDLADTLSPNLPHGLQSSAEGICTWDLPWLGLYLSTWLRKSSDFDFPSPNRLQHCIFTKTFYKAWSFLGGFCLQSPKDHQGSFHISLGRASWADFSVSAASQTHHQHFNHSHPLVLTLLFRLEAWPWLFFLLSLSSFLLPAFTPSCTSCFPPSLTPFFLLLKCDCHSRSSLRSEKLSPGTVIKGQ